MRENKIMVERRKDGIYMRMTDNENKGECFSLEWAKVKFFLTLYIMNESFMRSSIFCAKLDKRHQAIVKRLIFDFLYTLLITCLL